MVFFFFQTNFPGKSQTKPIVCAVHDSLDDEIGELLGGSCENSEDLGL